MTLPAIIRYVELYKLVRLNDGRIGLCVHLSNVIGCEQWCVVGLVRDYPDTAGQCITLRLSSVTPL
jgi:hypothetical protein